MTDLPMYASLDIFKIISPCVIYKNYTKIIHLESSEEG